MAHQQQQQQPSQQQLQVQQRQGGSNPRRRPAAAGAPARITFASISALQPPGGGPAGGGSSDATRAAQEALTQHAQRLLKSVRFTGSGTADGNGASSSSGGAWWWFGGGGGGAAGAKQRTPPAAPLAWLRMSDGGSSSSSGGGGASSSSAGGSRRGSDAADAARSGDQSDQPAKRRRFPLSAKQRQQQQEEQEREAARQRASSAAGGGSGGAAGGAGGQMLVAAATTAATTLLAAASSSFPGGNKQQPSNCQASLTAAATGSPASSSGEPKQQRNLLRHRQPGEGRDDAAADVVCVENLAGGRRRVYRLRCGYEDGQHWHGFDMVEDEQTHQGRLKELVRSYLLPQGFPESVAPQYAQYMGWRGVQYFFGGAMSVFTTKCLLGALGVAGRHSGEAAAAINWVLKDGAGRLGRFLFARWGRELDCELKQFRLAGDILMEAGAALELSTILAPNLFLPLACTANLAKNLAAVANSSTRAPIYRTFALQNNLADITAKGESVANLADIAGTLAGIALSKAKLPMVGTFVVLSAGYLVASRMEVDSVELPYLNRARLAYTSAAFARTGDVPTVREANKREPLLPWGRYHQGRIVLGASVEDAVASPSELRRAAGLYKSERFIINYRPDTKRVYVLLRDGASTADTLKAAFCAHMVLSMFEACPYPTGSPAERVRAVMAKGGRRKGSDADSSEESATASSAAGIASSNSGRQRGGQAGKAWDKWHKLLVSGKPAPGEGRAEHAQRLVAASKPVLDGLFADFSREAEKQGWKLAQTMLNPRETRLLRVQPLTA